MKSKKLLLINALLGIIGGITLITIIILLANTLLSSIYYSGSISTSIMLGMILVFIKISMIILGIVGILIYKDDESISITSNLLLIIAGVVAMIPFFNWLGGIIAIVSGVIGLNTIKNTDKE